MIVIENVENEIVLLEKLVCNGTKLMYQELKEINVGIIDLDFSLIRYLGKAVTYRDININISRYPIIEREDKTSTTLGRFILEYYSKYDAELKEILGNKEYEINHKNRNKLDNRIENLEIVTHTDNIKHLYGTSYDVVYSTKKLKKLQEQNKSQKQQIVDENYLKRMSSLFFEFMKKGQEVKKLLKCCYCYVRFKYIKSNDSNNTQNSMNINKKINLYNYKLLTNFCTNKLINLVVKKKQFIYRTIINKNIKLLKRYITRYSYLREVLKKYKLIDLDFKEELNFEHSNSKNLLYDLFKDIYDIRHYVIDNGDILIAVTLKQFFNVRGKYKAFLVAYLLGLLNRRDDISKPNTVSIYKVHTPSFINIPLYTSDLLKQANELSKDLLQLNLNKFTYFLVRQEFGEDLADNIYKNQRSKNNYKNCVRAKNDILHFLKTDRDLRTNGFITKEEIVEDLQGLNTQRAIRGEEYNKINQSFTNFITTLFLYNTDTKQVLNELGLVYTSLNKKIISNIKKHQKKHNLNFNLDLKSKKKVLVLKELTK